MRKHPVQCTEVPIMLKLFHALFNDLDAGD
jgi:hypothetical protein